MRFAKHIVNNNNYLADIAVNNPKSFETAFLQLASSGLTLDPAQKQAYLVPRDGRVILDVSILGSAGWPPMKVYAKTLWLN